jgi:hypothetical protein
MRALFRLTGKPVVDLLLVFCWWPIAAMMWAFGALIQRIEPAIERTRAGFHAPVMPLDPARAAEHARRLPASDVDRQAAVDFVTRRMSAQGVITADRLDELVDLKLAVDCAQTRGELAVVVGAPVEALDIRPSEPPHVRQRRIALIAVAGGVAFLSCVSAALWVTAFAVDGVSAPPRSWTEWCAQYSNADGSLKVGPPDIHRAVRATEKLPLPGDKTAANELRDAIVLAGSYDADSERAAAEHMTKVALSICS